MSDTKNTKEKLSNAITLGVEYLLDHQLPNGEFLLYMSGDEAMKGWNIPQDTVFSAALIGNCLLPLRKQDKVQQILLNTAHFLHYQMDKGGTWNYYTILHRLRNLCPLDLDDTSCVSSFLEKMEFKFPKDLNKKLIIDCRRNDGLFYTWITFRFRFNKNIRYWYLVSKELKYLIKSLVFWGKFECSRYDVDAVVNANILYYIGKRKETLPIITYLIKIINENKENDCDKWYRNVLTVYYFISRNFNMGIVEFKEIRSSIIDRILIKQKQDGSFGESALDTALAISSLINFNYNDIEINQGINFLLKTQYKNGNWDRRGLYFGGPKKLSCFGSEELTTGFCLEALAKFKNLNSTT